MSLLEVRNLAVDFRTSDGLVQAVRGVDFEVNAGEVLGIVGESGCGKSVTSLAVIGLLPKPNGYISEGRIMFDGADLRQLSEASMRQIRGNAISMIFQEPMTALNPVLPIGEQIGEVLHVHQDVPLRSRENRQRTIELLEMVGIPRANQVIHEYPHQFSGGMRQRVMIAMALSCHPKLLIADEPTTALDVTIQAQVLDLLRDLKEKLGTAVMFITHDLGVINEMADRVMVMYAGKIVEKASVTTLFADARHPYTRGLMRSRPGRMGRHEKLYCIPGMVPTMRNMPPGCPFAPRCENALPICSTSSPPLMALRTGHFVSCWLEQNGGDTLA